MATKFDISCMPQNYVMPLGIILFDNRLHFNILIKINDIIYRIEPHKHVSLQYKKNNVDFLLKTVPIYGEKFGTNCVDDSFDLLESIFPR